MVWPLAGTPLASVYLPVYFDALFVKFRQEGADQTQAVCLRKIMKGRRAFPNDEALLTVLFMRLQHVADKWTQPIPEWKAALNQCVILFGESVQVREKLHTYSDNLFSEQLCAWNRDQVLGIKHPRAQKACGDRHCKA